ncbi:hypothetical protein LOD99_14477 [Oopsacas minuta]|uniref:Uncharacterized protein n=1 Tax=Oopsacas minuta TaxID=111878 RepID=A0AAV7KHG1_9METZ|nr:hypothetical protein LOD99_14477 [Oopsacas minuta]
MATNEADIISVSTDDIIPPRRPHLRIFTGENPPPSLDGIPVTRPPDLIQTDDEELIYPPGSAISGGIGMYGRGVWVGEGTDFARLGAKGLNMGGIHPTTEDFVLDGIISTLNWTDKEFLDFFYVTRRALIVRYIRNSSRSASQYFADNAGDVRTGTPALVSAILPQKAKTEMLSQKPLLPSSLDSTSQPPDWDISSLTIPNQMDSLQMHPPCRACELSHPMRCLSHPHRQKNPVREKSRTLQTQPSCLHS